MGSDTTNHAFYKPNDGETGWGDDRRGDLDDLDVKLELRDTLANRPASPPADTWFIETDESAGVPGREWRYDGGTSSWVAQPLDIHKARKAGLVAFVSGDAIDTVDPSGTSTPVQDAMDAVDADSTEGSVWLPYGTVTEGAPLTPRTAVNLYGAGISSVNGSTLAFTSSGSASDHGFAMTGGDQGDLAEYDGFLIKGPGDDTTTGNAIYTEVNAGNISWGRVHVLNWAAAAIKGTSGSGTTAWSFEKLLLSNIDAGNANAIIDLDSWGPALQMSQLYLTQATATSSSLDSILLRVNTGTDVSIQQLNLGGTIKKVVQQLDDEGNVHLGQINFEPKNLAETSSPDSLFELRGPGLFACDQVRLNGGEATPPRYAFVYATTGGQNPAYKAIPRPNGDAAPASQEALLVNDGQDGYIRYGGPSTDTITIGPSSISPGVACLGDLTMVTS
jgi:hypothetical protein